MASLPFISFLVIFTTIPQPINGGISSLWDFCECRWGDWQAWEGCDSECNGGQVRERSAWIHVSKEACPYTSSTCATIDMFYEHRRCNAFCYHGGTSNSYDCACITGYDGDCCQFFFNSCSSVPCQNGGRCTNIPDSYICQCINGWSGTNCEIDVQSPIMSNCANDMTILTSDQTKSVAWTIPEFMDPHNTSLSITSNYVKNYWTFPWGDYKISYSALKPVNGKVTECLFEIKIRPFPCPTLNVPLNGAIMCNNWKTHYGHYCLFWCQEDYTVARGVDPTSWFVCGASGSWFPGTSIPDCSVRVSYLQSTSGYKLTNAYRNCKEQEEMMQTYYIDKLKESHFSYFCNKFPSECTKENTAVLCH